ncbi:MAG TPA: ATP-binding protein [Sediminispirochaeta sp.]|nr:ATP-binding protein [Sediminispirochaeta sp.]
MIPRKIETHVKSMFSLYPVITITGPRQSGKTTLVKTCFPQLPYRNLEHPETRQFAREDPIRFLRTVPDGAILDEIQNAPELTSYIQVEVDEKGKNGLFVLTGSRQFNVMEAVTQSLAGRTAIIKLLPFSFEEIGDLYPELGKSTDEYLFRGFYPRLYEQKIDPSVGLTDYIETYIERDLRQLSRIQDLLLFRKFLKLCAGRTGQLLNFSHLAEDTGISHKTAAEWISLLEASFIVFRLPPFFANINKRLIKSPKLYFYDTGLAANLLGIEEPKQIESHPLRGALFENMVISEVLKYRYNRGRKENLSFFRDAKGHEVDLLYHSGNDLSLVEIKSAGTMRKEFFKGLEYFHDSIKPAAKKILVYDGQRSENRSAGTVTNPRRLTSLL